jgi:hypothetical protein
MPAIFASLHFQTRSGFVVRGGVVAGRALRAARLVIRSRGFTLLDAWAAICGASPSVEARAAWRAAERAAAEIWDRLAPPGCPRAPELRLVLAHRRRR